MTVKQLKALIKDIPDDVSVDFGHFDTYLNDNLEPTKVRANVEIAPKEAYDLYPVETVEYTTVYLYSIRRGGYYPHTCLVIST